MVINALKYCKNLVYGCDFTVHTNHQALRSANWSDRKALWSQYFKQFACK